MESGSQIQSGTSSQRPFSSPSHPRLAYREALQRWPEIVRELDEGIGYVHLTGFPVEGTVGETARVFEALVSRLGKVTPHGASQETIWRVTPRRELNHVPTFSEAASEAPLHTDNSWVSCPEKYFALLAIRPASDGGDTFVFPVMELLNGFAATASGSAALRVLRERQFPFTMPAVFRSASEHAQGITPLATAPVIGGDNRFRFRYDVIQAGFQLRPDLALPESVAAIETFQAFLDEKLARTPGLRLERGDCLIANNQTVLHARSPFTDPDRLLLRARIAEVAQ